MSEGVKFVGFILFLSLVTIGFINETGVIRIHFTFGTIMHGISRMLALVLPR